MVTGKSVIILFTKVITIIRETTDTLTATLLIQTTKAKSSRTCKQVFMYGVCFVGY